MPSRKRDLATALQDRAPISDRPHIVQAPGERFNSAAIFVSVDRVRRNPNQPRRVFDAETLNEFAASIKERGILQPLVVRSVDDRYQIIMGERRYRAALLAELDEVPVIVRNTTDEEAFIEALVENLQRTNLTPEEESDVYRGLLEKGYSSRRIAEKIGVAQSKVSRVVRIYEDPTLAEAIADGKITKSQAQEMLTVPEEEKERLVTFVAGRRKEKQPVTLNGLRAEVERVRQGARPESVLDDAPAVGDPEVEEHPEIGAVREQARMLRGMLEAKPSRVLDGEIAEALAAIRVLADRSKPLDESVTASVGR